MMNPIRFVLVVLLAINDAKTPAAAQPSRQSERSAPHPTRLIAKLKEEPGAANRAARLIRDHDLAVRKRVGHSPGLLVLDETAAAAVGQANATPQERKKTLLARLNALRQSGLFEFVEPDYVLTANADPSDIAYQNGTLWGLHRISVASAWDITTGSTNLIVAVVDSGIRHTHQDLAAQMWRNPGETAGNGVDDDHDGIADNVYGINAINNSGNTLDDNSHGTHVAGTIGAAANNAGPVVGVCWNVRLMACKFLDSTGHGYTSDAIECIDFAAANGARIINCSWGGGEYSQALFNSLSRARTAGVLVVVAAGNDAMNIDSVPTYPASYNLDNIIVVAAITQNGSLASSSNYGQTSVDLAAPGVGIYSCTAASDASYDTYNGTSMAAPHVTGVAALILAQAPSLGLGTLRQRLLGSTVPLASLSGRCTTGGRVDAFKALSSAPDGILEISTTTSSSSPFNPASSVNLFVNVSDVSPVTNATVIGQIVGGGPLSFANDGVSPDTAAGDGTYSAVLNVPSTGSNVTVRIVISAPGKQTATNSPTFQILQPPTNDHFANRTTLTGTTTTATGSNVGATKEPGEPLHAENSGGKSVWWTWTAPSSGPVRVASTGSDFDTTLGVYTGNSIGTLSLVASDDDSGGWPASAVTFDAVSGTTYQVAVDGFDGGFRIGAASGNIRLNIAEQDRLYLLAPQRVPRGGFRIWVASADGSPIDPARASRLEIHALTNVAQQPGSLTRLTGTLAQTNGLMWLDDPSPADQPVRFYRLVER